MRASLNNASTSPRASVASATTTILSISSAGYVETAHALRDMHAHIEQVRAVAQHEGLSQSCLERLEKAERVVPKMQATIEFVSG